MANQPKEPEDFEEDIVNLIGKTVPQLVDTAFSHMAKSKFFTKENTHNYVTQYFASLMDSFAHNLLYSQSETLTPQQYKGLRLSFLSECLIRLRDSDNTSEFFASVNDPTPIEVKNVN